MNILDKAKTAAGSVTEKVGGVTETVTNKVGELGETFTAKVAEMKDVVLDRVNATIAEINLLLPHLVEIGFKLDEMVIEVGIPTRLSLKLEVIAEAKAEAFQHLLDEHRDKALFCSVVKLLLQSQQIAHKITYKNIGLAAVEISVGVPSSARITFLEKV